MKYLLILFCLTALALWIGCSEDSGVNDPGPSSDDFESVISSGGVPPFACWLSISAKAISIS